jgi:quinoprotein glucose dehydrogenase
MHRWFSSLIVGLGCALALLLGTVHSSAGQEPYKPKVAGASDEGQKAIKRIRVPAGTVATLVAAEPLLANPVCICFDEKGNLYVAETFRLHSGVTDNRSYMGKRKGWLDEEMACRTVAERVAMYKKLLGKEFDNYTKDHERIRLLVDTDGDGIYDKATVFADGFNTPASGLGAGLIARGGKIWYTCIPDLWLLSDSKGSGKADSKKSLHYGYGVHTAYIGHDAHGLIFGPDGKLYFSIGDRGLHVETAGRTVSNPDSGAVLRCNPDGSELEIVAVGLRNPQCLAFDQYGNLFTGDNNADAGDAARCVYIVEGGDSGWRLGNQELNFPTRLGMWNTEKVWHLQHAGQPAHVVPPVGHIANGPSGLAYHPGVTQLPERYKDHFFLCDFRGGSGGSGIHAFQLKPKGATFEFAQKPEQFVWSILATDCKFGPDGGFYFSDWVEGWVMTGKGRIYKIGDPNKAKSAEVLQVKELIAAGMAGRDASELAKLLTHLDQRIRQEAQFELAARGEAKVLLTTATGKKHDRMARLHAMWGLGQIARQQRGVLEPLIALTADKDGEVRAQACKVLGDGGCLDAFRALVEALKDPQPRVRYFATQSLGKLGKVDAVAPILDMLRDNADKDAYLRHAAVVALVRVADRETINAVAKDPLPSVRLVALLVMRRLQMPEIARFLSDVDANLVMEAARAINDQPIDKAMPQLAALITRTGLPDTLLYRVLNANFRLGGAEHAQALAKFAGRTDVPVTAGVEALRYLGNWAKPPGRDRIVGLWRPLAPRTEAVAVEALRLHLGSIFTGRDAVRGEAAKLAAQFGIKEVGPVLWQMFTDKAKPGAVRVEMLKALEAIKDSKLSQAMELALLDTDPRVRTQGRKILAKLEPAKILPLLKTALDDGTVLDRQGAFAILADLKQPGTGALIETWLDKLLAKQVPPQVQLDLLEAAGKHPSADILKKLKQYEAGRDPKDHLAKWSETLYGGDPEKGQRIFFERAEVSCLRCHKIHGVGGEVGPDLTGIGAKQKRDYLLESLVEPDKQIAKGYETVVLTLNDGKVKSGILKSEDKKEVRLMTPDGTLIVVPVSEIDTRSRGPSAMPADLVRHLSRQDLRDLVEFLANLK